MEIFPDLFLVSLTVNVLFQELHSLERLYAVDAVNQHKAICKSVVMSRKLYPLAEATGVIEADLLSCAAVCLYGANVDVFKSLHGLRAYTVKMSFQNIITK